MLIFIIIALLVILTLVPIALQNTYSNLPLKELKRRASGGDELAQTLHNAAAFGGSLYLFLWGIAGLSASVFAVLIVRNLQTPAALLSIVMLIAIAFGWLPRSHPGPISRFLTRQLTPVVAWVLQYVHPVLSRANRLEDLYRAKSQHLDIYEKEDLLDILTEQKTLSHNRIEEKELDLSARALTFGDKLIRDLMTPLRKAKTVKASEAAGPVLIDELHKTALSIFPVVEGKDKVIGLLFLDDLMRVIKHQQARTVKDVMDEGINYLHEEQSLNEALEAMQKTGRQLFVVTNDFKDPVGVITSRDIMQELWGQSADDFDKYSDVEAVIQRNKDQHTEPEEIQEPEEVTADETDQPEDQKEEPESESSEPPMQLAEEPVPADEEVEEPVSGESEPHHIPEEDIDETIEID